MIGAIRRLAAWVRRVVLVTGWTPWILSGLALAPFAVLPATRATAVVAAAVGGGVLLLLATSASWRGSRRVVEWLGLSVTFHAIALAAMVLPWSVQIGITPMVLLVGSICVFAVIEWRYAPDCGQEGWGWAVDAAVRPALGVAFGIGVVLPWLAATLALPVGRWVPLLLLALGALGGRAADLLVLRPRMQRDFARRGGVDPEEPDQREFDLSLR